MTEYALNLAGVAIAALAILGTLHLGIEALAAQAEAQMSAGEAPVHCAGGTEPSPGGGRCADGPN